MRIMRVSSALGPLAAVGAVQPRSRPPMPSRANSRTCVGAVHPTPWHSQRPAARTSLAARERNLSPTTFRRYKNLLRHQILPRIGHVQLNRITSADVRALYQTLRREGGVDGRPLAGSTVRQAHNILRAALAPAAEEGKIPADPTRAKATEPPASMATITFRTPLAVRDGGLCHVRSWGLMNHLPMGIRY